MSINFNAYGFKTNDMNMNDLEVGQKLVRIIRPRYYDSYYEVRTAEYTIVKILKTRVVVAPVDGGSELRLLTEQGKWAFRPGTVKTDIEGSTQGWNQASYEFATEDEAELIAQIIAHRAAQVAEKKVKDAARAKVREIAGQLHPDLASVDAAIEALTALRAQLAGEAE